MKRLILAVSALGFAACAAPANTETPAIAENTQAVCAARGGNLERVGRAQTLQCVVPFADAGKSCTDGGECQSGRCLGSVDASGQSNVTGQCQASNMQFGCYTHVRNGRAEAAICVD